MKKIVCFTMVALIIGLGFISCKPKQEELQKWEYQTVRFYGNSYSKFYDRIFPEERMQDSLKSLGENGWELVNIYTLNETVHPNFGNEKYVTGLQPNTRTSAIYYIFKRPKIEVESSKDEKANETDEDTAEVAEVAYEVAEEESINAEPYVKP